MSTLEDDFAAMLDSVNRMDPAQVYADRDGLREQLDTLDRARRAVADNTRRQELDKLSTHIDAVITVKVHRHMHPLVIDSRPPQPPARDYRRER